MLARRRQAAAVRLRCAVVVLLLDVGASRLIVAGVGWGFVRALQLLLSPPLSQDTKDCKHDKQDKGYYAANSGAGNCAR